MAEAVYICYWQCSEYKTNFIHVLNIIIELKRKKISANFTNILHRLNAGDEINSISEEDLGKLLKFACDQNYICKYTYKNNVSYRVKEKDLDGECDICLNILLPYSETTELINGINAKDSTTGETNTLNEALKTYDKKINLLTAEIENKDIIINILISKLTDAINEN